MYIPEAGLGESGALDSCSGSACCYQQLNLRSAVPSGLVDLVKSTQDCVLGRTFRRPFGTATEMGRSATGRRGRQLIEPSTLGGGGIRKTIVERIRAPREAGSPVTYGMWPPRLSLSWLRPQSALATAKSSELAVASRDPHFLRPASSFPPSAFCWRRQDAARLSAIPGSS